MYCDEWEPEICLYFWFLFAGCNSQDTDWRGISKVQCLSQEYIHMHFMYNTEYLLSFKPKLFHGPSNKCKNTQFHQFSLVLRFHFHTRNDQKSMPKVEKRKQMWTASLRFKKIMNPISSLDSLKLVRQLTLVLVVLMWKTEIQFPEWSHFLSRYFAQTQN